MRSFKVALICADDAHVADWVRDRLAAEGIDLVARRCTTREELMECAGEADVVWTGGGHMSAEYLQAIPHCGAIIRMGSGTDNLPVAEATEGRIIVANTPEAHSDSVSDHAIALLFAVVRQIAVQDRTLRTRGWDHRLAPLPVLHVRGQTLGLVGFGHIAKCVAHKMSGFDMTILAYDPYVSDEAMASAGVCAAALDDVLSRSDFVSLHCPITKDTYHLIDERELRLMKSSSVLINTARGAVVNETVLVAALREGWIAGAGLDVFEQEPTDPGNPLFTLDNAVVTPHISSSVEGAGERCWGYALETVVDLANGRWPRSYVNHDVDPKWNLTQR
jgi:D-3-phosphoglycerate dehydrogenase